MYYSCGLKQARARLDSKLIVAFNACLDLVKYIKAGELEALELSGELSPLKECIAREEQSEIAVSQSTLDYLIKSLGYDEKRAGGLVGQAAREVPNLGVEVYSHIAAKCRELTGLFSDRVLISTSHGFRPAPDFSEDCIPPSHFVMEFEKGLEVFGKELKSSTRFIATHDSYAFDFILDEQFFESIKEEVGKINKAVLSGFHLVLEAQASKIRRVEKIIEEWREINPHIFIHLELGQFQSEKALKETEKLFPLVDSLGLNEEELRYITGEEGLEEGLSFLAEKTERVLFHSQHCSALITSQDNLKEAKAALQFASLCSAYKVLHGRVPSIREMESFSPPRPSRHGIKISQRLRRLELDGKKTVAVPSLYVEKPRSLVGAGDTFAVAYALVI